MPIHDQGYRHYAGQRAPHGQAWMVIARTHLLAALKYRPFQILLLVAWGRFAAYAVRIYFATNVPQAPAFFAVSPQLFQDFLSGQSIFVFLVTIAQAGLIADAHQGAMQRDRGVGQSLELTVQRAHTVDERARREQRFAFEDGAPICTRRIAPGAVPGRNHLYQRLLVGAKPIT